VFRRFQQDFITRQTKFGHILTAKYFLRASSDQALYILLFYSDTYATLTKAGVPLSINHTMTPTAPSGPVSWPTTHTPLILGTKSQLHGSNCMGGAYCYKPRSTPLFFFSICTNPTPITTQPVLPITPDLPEEDINKTLEQFYDNLTHFVISHHCTLNSDLLSHQLNGAQPVGILPDPYSALLPSCHHYPNCKDTITWPLDPHSDLYLPSDTDSSPKIVTFQSIAPNYSSAFVCSSPSSSIFVIT
jgi:hypothetical protein